MEKDFSHIHQLWKVFRRIRNQTAARAQKGDKSPLSIGELAASLESRYLYATMGRGRRGLIDQIQKEPTIGKD